MKLILVLALKKKQPHVTFFYLVTPLAPLKRSNSPFTSYSQAASMKHSGIYIKYIIPPPPTGGGC